jgi:hypothetical protein
VKRNRELTPAGFEDPTLGIGESREVRGRELVERALDVVEAAGDFGGGAAEGRRARLGGSGRGGSRVAQERLARGGVGAAPGGEERLGLARGERMALDRAGEAELVRRAEGAQGAGERERQAAAIDA